MSTENNDDNDLGGEEEFDIFADNNDSEPKELTLESTDNSEPEELTLESTDNSEQKKTNLDSSTETITENTTQENTATEKNSESNTQTNSQTSEAAFIIISSTKIPKTSDLSFKDYWEKRTSEISKNLQFATKHSNIENLDEIKDLRLPLVNKKDLSQVKEYFINLKALYENINIDINPESETILFKKQDTIIATIKNSAEQTIVSISNLTDINLQEQAILLTTHELTTHKSLYKNDSKLEISASEDSDPLMATRIYQKTLLEGHDPDISEKTLTFWREQADKIKDEVNG
jgi:hypothetical protein